MSMIISGFLFPIISDYGGRKLAMMTAVLITGVSLLTAGFAPSYFYWMIAIAFGGLGLAGIEITSLVYVSEISGPRFRNNSNVILNMAWSLSQVFLGPIFALIANWRWVFIFVLGIPFIILFIIGLLVFDETPRYLVTAGKYDVT